MSKNAEQRLQALLAADAEAIRDFMIGLEKECLRVNDRGSISQRPHPMALGAALTNPYITTDYSEALLELITPPFDDVEQALAFLADAEQFVYANLRDELLWSTSMPCVVAGESSIPIARYGHSNAGRMKHLYRLGLGHRYGRVMQVIAGVHYNFSFGERFWDALYALEGGARERREFVDARYFGLLRNLQRVGWLIPYLFGASPAVCKSFLSGPHGKLEAFDGTTYYGPHATSLRMGDIGYQNNQENEVGVKACYDSLDAYVESLARATETPCPEYARIGVKVDGEYRQLNANILQIENEYYSTVRPKQPPLDDEKPSLALKRRGVRYVELRSLDINAFDPLGISDTQLNFLEALMLHCLLCDSPPIGERERIEIDENEMNVAHHGRQPGLRLMRQSQEVRLHDWGQEVLGAMLPACRALDGDADGPHVRALAEQRALLEAPELTPSARMLAEMRERGEGFFAFAKRKSMEHREFFQQRGENPERTALFSEETLRSLRAQQSLEAADTSDFDTFLAHYFSQ